MSFEIKLNDFSDGIIEEFKKNKAAALEAVGQQLVSYTKSNIKAIGLIDTSRLINSITHVTKTHPGRSRRFKTDKQGTVLVDRDIDITIDDEDKVIIGTAVAYAPYHEYGTGIYAEGGTGRKTPWKYRAFNRKTGRYEAIWTRGTKPKHFMRNAIANHEDVIKRILERYLSGKG